jgi:RNA polymerase sigma-70 factor (ECF subfamily)
VIESAEDELLLAVEHGDVGSALRGLSTELRTIVQATLIDGLTTREAAQFLGLPHGTVKSRMRAAKAQLRTRFVAEQGRRLS